MEGFALFREDIRDLAALTTDKAVQEPKAEVIQIAEVCLQVANLLVVNTLKAPA